jgi:hypothetical protein
MKLYTKKITLATDSWDLISGIFTRALFYTLLVLLKVDSNKKSINKKLYSHKK